jgi:hypothetical protein
MRMRANSIVLACLLLSAGAQAPKAATIDVQFEGFGSAYTGAAVVGTTGDYWNSMAFPGTDPLADTGGNYTGVTLTFNDPIYTACCGDGFSVTPYAALMASYLYDGVGNTMTVADLVPDATFDLYIYTQGDVASNGRAIEVDANGVIVDSAPTDATASTFILGQNYLDLAVTADVNGLLTINYSTLAGESDINGFQLVQTGSDAPEPATLASLAAGLAVVAWRKRRELAR